MNDVQIEQVAPDSPEVTQHGTWSESAVRVLKERYLMKNDRGEPIETPDELCWRVGRAIAAAEAINSAKSPAEIEAVAARYADLMLSRRFMPNSPTLANAGKGNNMQLSACFVLPVPDDLAGIFETIKHVALVQKSGGGTGMSFSRLRPKDSIVSSTKGVASGPVSFMRVFDAATEGIRQGGMRRGANMGILRVDHPDIEEFIDCKRTGGITNFNISVAVTDSFMDALQRDGNYDLIDPHTQEKVRSVKARQIFDKIIAAAWASGDPGLVFLDRANHSTANPTPEIEQLEATNPCGEQFLGPYDACNLGSINLGLFVHEGEVDWRGLEATTRDCVRFLDDVIDVNPFPLEEIRQHVHANRRIGLGVMGWADMLFKLGTRYDSPEAIDLGERIMRAIQHWANEETEQLATERGSFPNWDRSIYKNGPQRRNATTTTVAPTGTICIIADCSSGIEPIFAVAFQHRVKQPDGNYRVLEFVNPIFVTALEASDIADKAGVLHWVKEHGSMHGHPAADHPALRAFVTAHEIAPEWHIRMQAAFQKGVQNSISKTINLPNSATPAEVEAAYLMAWDLGCLGITVFRDGCKGEQVLNVGVKQAEPTPPVAPAVAEPAPVPTLRRHHYTRGVKDRPEVMRGYTRQVRAPEGKVNVTLNDDEDGLLELFVTVGKAGSDVAALAEALGRLISLHLRVESPLSQNDRARAIAEQLRGIGGSSSIGFGPDRVRSLPDAVARAVALHLDRDDDITAPQGPALRDSQDHGHANGRSNGKAHASSEVTGDRLLKVTGNFCPQCGSNTLVYEEGCKKCLGCGHSEC